MRDELRERAPLRVLAGTALRRHEPPLIPDLCDFLLRDVVEKHIATENRWSNSLLSIPLSPRHKSLIRFTD